MHHKYFVYLNDTIVIAALNDRMPNGVYLIGIRRQ